MPRRVIAALLALAGALLLCARIGAVTRLASADGQFWDIQDTSAWAQDSGGIATGGRAYPFNGFGYLKLRVRAPGGTPARPTTSDQSPVSSVQFPVHYLRGFGLTHDGGERFDSLTPVLVDGILVSRGIMAPADTIYLRYVDSFTNTTAATRVVQVAWGGAAGAYADGGKVAIAITSSGDRRIDASDTFVTVMQNARDVADPMRGPSGHGPSAHVLGTSGAPLRSGVGDMYANPFVDAYPGDDPAHIGYVYTLRLRPGETAALMTFVVKGLSEVYDPRGGFPIPIKDGLVTGEAVYAGPDARIPAPGSEIAKVTEIARQLVTAPDLRGLTPRQRARIVNWKLPASTSIGPFTVFEKSVSDLVTAMRKGVVTSEDIVREYLARLSLYDRNGPTFRSMLSLNPRVFVEARAADRLMTNGQWTAPFGGVPVVFKDNIDVLGLPTTGGSRALVDHLPRLDSRVAAGMRKAGAIVLGKSNLDEFPFGDFGISTVGGTIGNAYEPSLSTAGSSGGSATAVSASLAALGFGTDTCNSLSNPAAFAALSTIRTTRGLTSRAGVMPLRPYNDAVGPMARTVRDVALALDAVTGSDPEDPVTAEAPAHIQGSFADGLDAASLKDKRIGVLRQRFVGITGEREIATMMERVVQEFRSAGATVVDVAIPDLDARYRVVVRNAPGSVKDAWTAYLSRGVKPGDTLLTIEDLLGSGKLAPGSVSRFRDALRPAPTGAALEEETRRFYESREAFRQLFVDLLEQQQLDAILYPANQARPHTHEGGLERYGGEPGTCIESAVTGLPQVTVPAGFMANRYPVGISLLGRMWDDKGLLELAAAYERLTHHRRPPPTVR